MYSSDRKLIYELQIQKQMVSFSCGAPNGCELSGPAFIINEEARSPRNGLQVQMAHEAGPAPASC